MGMLTPYAEKIIIDIADASRLSPSSAFAF
jgi:hypothetical protein